MIQWREIKGAAETDWHWFTEVVLKPVSVTQGTVTVMMINNTT